MAAAPQQVAPADKGNHKGDGGDRQPDELRDQVWQQAAEGPGHCHREGDDRAYWVHFRCTWKSFCGGFELISRVGIAMKVVSLLSQLPMTEGRQENSKDNSKDNSNVWLGAAFLFGLLFGMRIMRLWTDRSSRAVAHLDLGAPGPLGKSRVPQCKIERETSSQMPMPKRFPRRTIATQSQCTYTRHATHPKFRPLPAHRHGVFFESEMEVYRPNDDFPFRKCDASMLDSVKPEDEELFQEYYFFEGGPGGGQKSH